ncbi:arylsulfatase [Sulfurisoma sediminicola]|uniref:Arylsulfatase n=1 Tax=Sulfurisoma sediminicola TaxID=1381557 RepID=A0A497XKC9_9PROT|nr:arylsulfatase [Sulfurisoma sediminicola]RLJ67847.1 arylsulfatase [Sulfurisoma sediminicola]
MNFFKHKLGRSLAVMVVALASSISVAQATEKKPNILILWGDDIGQFNVSAYNRGMMGYKTPNIDSIANQGALFTDWYGQQSCTAGRAAFITGQSPIRTGLTKVGLPGAPEGLKKDDPTLAELLKPMGYATGQFGKNHLGDRNDMLPTVHGFDEWFGNLYHLNAEEEPEHVDYPKDPQFKAKFGPRGVFHCFATDKDDPTNDPRFGKVGKQKCKDTGPLTKKRMETIDEEVTAGAIKFMSKSVKDGKPFFLWWNSSRMHVFTHLKKESEGKTGYGIYADGMVEHDGHVGQLLAKLKELGVDDNTIVMYSSDNGAEMLSWPDGGSTMFRGEKNTPWEGGFRVPTVIRWPGVIKPGTVINDIGAHEDMMPTLLAAVGDTTVKEDLMKGRKVGDMTYKVHLDGYNLLPFFKGDVKASPRESFIYWTDDGSVAALRYRDYKIQFLKQTAVGLRAWQHPFEAQRAPLLTNLRMDPFERAEAENTEGYQKWYIEHMFAFAPAAAYVGAFLQSFREFPPRMKPGSFSLDRVMDSVTAPAKGSN